MNNSDLLDIGVGIIILGLIILFLWIDRKWHKRVDNSVGEKYMQLMAAFMKIEGTRIEDMSENHVELILEKNDKRSEGLSITQNEQEVVVRWHIIENLYQLNEEFRFSNNKSQEEIMEQIAIGISKAKRKMS